MKATRIISIVSVLCICFVTLFGCSAGSTALVVNSTPVSKEIYGYFLSVAANSDEYKKADKKQDVANKLCAEYVAGMELIEKYAVKLSAEEKVIVSTEVKTNWQLYSDFYKKFSVSKQALCTMLEYENLINALTEKLYSAGGEREIPETEVKGFFKKHYTAARVAFAPFDASMSKNEIDSITDKFTAMSGTVRSGSEFSSAIQQYPDLAEYEDVEHIISYFDSSYPDGFFEKIAKIQNGGVQVLRFSNGIYLVKKADVMPFFEVYKSKCIVKMQKARVLDEIEKTAESYKVEINSAVTKEVLRSAGVR